MIEAVLDLFPESAAFADGGLTIGGIRATELAEEFGTPLVVYCERTLRSQARAYREAAPDALVVYGSKAFPNLALLRLFAEEGSARTCRRSASSSSRDALGFPASGWSSTATTSRTRSCAPPPRPRRRSSCSTRRTRSSGRRRPECAASSSA